MVIDPVTGRIVWTPVASQIGEQRVILRAKNTTEGVALHDFTIDVAAPNSTPIITSTRSTVLVVGKPWTYAVEAQDAEQTVLHYALLSGPASAAVDSDSGLVQWTPAISDVGIHNLIVEVSDGMGGVTQHAITVTVQVSSIDSQPFSIRTPRGEASLMSKYLARIDGVDAKGQKLTAELLSGPTGLTLSASGLIQWMPTVAQLGPQSISVRYRSSTGSTEEHSFVIVVRQVVSNVAPKIVSEPIEVATLGRLYSYDVQR